MSLSLEKTRLGRRYFRRSAVALLDNAIPANPSFIDKWHGGWHTAVAHPDNYSLVLSQECSSYPLKVGIISDTHQNSVFLQMILDEFSLNEVSVVFSLGDYSYTKKPDDALVRARQVGKSLELLGHWLDDDQQRKAVVLLGNHEQEEWYFATDESKQAVRREVEKWYPHDRMYFVKDPFKSFEVENSLDVVLFVNGDLRRSFRLAHAVTTEFVESLYKGLDAADLTKRLPRIETFLGKAWLDQEAQNAPTTRARWERFLNSSHGSKEFMATTNEIYAALRTQMNVQKFLRALQAPGQSYKADAAAYCALVEKVIKGEKDATQQFRDFWGPPDWVDVEFTSSEFALDLKRLYSALGIGRMYSLCGHFHADLGMFDASSEFDTSMIAVGGAQPRKLIGQAFTAYILEIDKPFDTLYRISMNDDHSVPEFEWDLTFNQWRNDVGWS